MTTILDDLRRFPEARLALEPPFGGDLADYAERHIRLPSGTNAKSGAFSWRYTPHARAWAVSMSTPGVRQVTLCCGTQVAKTTAILLRLAYGVAGVPVPSLYVGPRGDDVTEIMRRRLEPIFRASPDMARRMPRQRRDWSKKEILFGNGAAIFTGTGGSMASITGKPCGVVVGDEFDLWRSPHDHLRQMEQRTQTWRDSALIVLASNAYRPAKQVGIYQQFLEGNRSYYEIRCPHCRELQRLQESQLHYETEGDSVRNVRYLCESCGVQITDEQKHEALLSGEWRAERPEVKHHHSYQLSTLYSIDVPFAKYAQALHRASQDWDSRGRMFCALWRGIPYDPPPPDQLKEGDPETRKQPRRRGSVPREAHMLGVGVDVQSDYMVYVVRAAGYDLETWGVEHGKVFRWDDLKAAIWRSWQSFGTPPPVARVCIDMADGNRTEEVYAWAAEHYGTVWPARGSSTLVIPTRIHRVEKSKLGAIGLGRTYVEWSHQWFFGAMHAGMHKLPGQRGAWWVPEDFDEEYFRQIRNKHRVLENGKIEWVKRGADHYADAEAMALVALELAGARLLVRGGAAAADTPRPEQQATKPGGGVPVPPGPADVITKPRPVATSWVQGGRSRMLDRMRRR